MSASESQASSTDGLLTVCHRLVADYLKEKGFVRTLECFEEEDKKSGVIQGQANGNAFSVLPPLEMLVESWRLQELAKTVDALALVETSPLDVPLGKLTPEIGPKLDLIHATNVLSVSRHSCPRLEFDTASASYRHYTQDCIVSTAADRTVKMTDWRTKEVAMLFSASSLPGFHDSPILAHAFHPTHARLLATGAMDGQVIITDTTTRCIIHKFADHQKFVVRIAFSQDGQWLASASYDKTVNLYRLSSQFKIDEDFRIEGQYSKVHTLKYKTNPETLLFLPHNLLLVTCRNDNLLRYLSLERLEETKSNINELGDNHVSFSIMDTSLHPTQEFIALQTDSSIARIIIVATPQIPLGQTDPAVPPVSKHLRTFYIGAAQDAYTTPRHAWCPIPHSPHQKDSTAVLVCAGDDGLIRIVDIEKGRTVQKVAAHDAVVRTIFAGVDGTEPYVLTGSFDRTIRVTKLVM